MTTAAQDYAKKCQQAASKGNVIAQNTLGYLYLHGQGVKKDYTQAVEWFNKAANQNYAPAQFNLAIMYKLGQGIEQNYSESIKWLHRSSQQNYVEAQTSLGDMFYQGLGIMQDYEMAYLWWSLAEKNGAEDIAHKKEQLIKKMTQAQINNADQAIASHNVQH